MAGTEPGACGIVLTCEHASPRAPVGSGLDPALCLSHVGWDRRAVGFAEALGRALGVPVLAGEWTRLYVDLNRSSDRPEVVPLRSFGVEISANRIDAAAREARIAEAWRPFRAEARQRIDAAIARHGRALHLSVHSFTEALDPRRRDFDLGVLFDPTRPTEAEIARAVIAACAAHGVRARPNEPYLGIEDGHTAAVRRDLPDAVYAGLELELRDEAGAGLDAGIAEWVFRLVASRVSEM